MGKTIKNMFKSITMLALAAAQARELLSGTASTTRYWDCSGGACGCGFGNAKQPTFCHANGMFAAPSGNEHGAKFYGTAALSQQLGGGDWQADGCGKCFKVTYGGSTVVLKGTNYCPPSNSVCNGQAHFDIAAPGYDYPGASESNPCAHVGEEQSLHPPQVCAYSGVGSCNCGAFQDKVLQAGCSNFRSLGWDNPVVNYEELESCPKELTSAPACWEDNGEQWPSTSPATCSDPGAKPGPKPPKPPTPTYDY